VRYHYRVEDFPDRKFDSSDQIGWLAGDVREVLPELVVEDADGFMHVAYGRASAVVAQAVSDLNSQMITRLDAATTEIAELRETIKMLVQEIANLKK
jgi:hypothetical protein